MRACVRACVRACEENAHIYDIVCHQPPHVLCAIAPLVCCSIATPLSLSLAALVNEAFNVAYGVRNAALPQASEEGGACGDRYGAQGGDAASDGF